MAATVVATAQEPAAKRQQAATTAPVALRHCRPGRFGRGGGRRRATSPSRRPSADHPLPRAGNRDASLFFGAAPDT
ncbi:MAG: hypothetical protein ABSC06_35320, partial [Rhodopila sp.]